jgi:hypothetical protein
MNKGRRIHVSCMQCSRELSKSSSLSAHSSAGRISCRCFTHVFLNFEAPGEMIIICLEVPELFELGGSQ